MCVFKRHQHFARYYQWQLCIFFNFLPAYTGSRSWLCRAATRLWSKNKAVSRSKTVKTKPIPPSHISASFIKRGSGRPFPPRHLRYCSRRILVNCPNLIWQVRGVKKMLSELWLSSPIQLEMSTHPPPTAAQGRTSRCICLYSENLLWTRSTSHQRLKDALSEDSFTSTSELNLDHNVVLQQEKQKIQLWKYCT